MFVEDHYVIKESFSPRQR